MRPEDFKQASREEMEGAPHSHEGVKVLRQHLRSKIMGSDENRLASLEYYWALRQLSIDSGKSSTESQNYPQSQPLQRQDLGWQIPSREYVCDDYDNAGQPRSRHCEG